MRSKGMFLSLDGLDGSGKSTQCRLLADYLKSIGIAVVLCQDPGSTEIGRDLRRIVLHHQGDLSRSCEANLFMAARAQMLAEIILPALERGETVISDRYLMATLAYQGHGSGLDISGLRQATLFAAGGLLPDLSIVLDISVTTARGRLGANPDRLERRPQEYHERVRQGFLHEASRDVDRIAVVSAEATTDEVHSAVLSAFKTWRARHELE